MKIIFFFIIFHYQQCKHGTWHVGMFPFHTHCKTLNTISALSEWFSRAIVQNICRILKILFQASCGKLSRMTGMDPENTPEFIDRHAHVKHACTCMASTMQIQFWSKIQNSQTMVKKRFMLCFIISYTSVVRLRFINTCKHYDDIALSAW